MAALKLQVFSFWILLSVSCTQARSTKLKAAPLSCPSLPPPDLVNAFLNRNCRDANQCIMNPLIGDQSLQVIKCQSLGTNAGHQSFDFYQVKQANQSEACKRPPPLETKVHRRPLTLSGRYFWHPSVVAIFTGFITTTLLVGGSTIWIACHFLAWFAFGTFWLWMQLLDAVTAGQPLEGAPGESDKDTVPKDVTEWVTAALESDVSKSYWTNLDRIPSLFRVIKPATAAFLKTTVRQVLEFFYFLVIGLTGLSALFIVMGLAAFLGFGETPEGVKCLYPEAWLEVVGPVRLPDPSQGLNQYLSSQPGGSLPSLQLCTTRKLQFYTACPSSCRYLRDPYGNLSPLEAPPVSGGCSSRWFRLFVWLSIIVGAPASIIILFSTLMLFGMCFGACCGCIKLAPNHENNTASEVELENLDKDSAGVESTGL